MIEEFNNKNYNYELIKLEQIKEDIKNNPFGKYLLFIEENNVIGYLYYSDIYDRLEINQIEVQKKYRKKGYATQLINKLIELNKDITLEVKKDNYNAINLYEKVGFKEVAIREKYYNGIDGILMERKKDS